MNDMMIDAFPIPALLIGSNERVVHANIGAHELFGSAIDGRHYITVLRQPGLLDAIETTLRVGQKTETSYLSTVARRDMTWHVTVSPVDLDGALHALMVLEDRTAMREAGQMRRDFVANVSHELRTPLTAVLGFIETLRGAAKDDPAARDRFLTIMEREANRMNRLVGDLLSLSRVEAEERVRPKGSANLTAILNEVVATLKHTAADQSVSIETVGLEVECAVPGDPDQLAQVFTNLVENAIKYSGNGAKVRINLRQEARNEMLGLPAVTVDVTDNGAGFDPVHVPRLTERFYRIDSHRSREMGGTGLGLAIVKHIVNRHRGRLKIESAVGHGSRFSITLPTN